MATQRPQDWTTAPYQEYAAIHDFYMYARVGTFAEQIAALDLAKTYGHAREEDEFTRLCLAHVVEAERPTTGRYTDAIHEAHVRAIELHERARNEAMQERTGERWVEP